MPSGVADELIARFADCLGVEVGEPEGDGRVQISWFVDTREEARALAQGVERELARRGLPAELATEAVLDEGWVAAYQRSLVPFPFASRFLVCPAGPPGGDLPEDRVPLRIEPGRAFGTGEHPTTRMCAALLEREVRRDTRWIDLGCGNGILSLVARHCGAREVLAIDVDPDAVEVAGGTIRANGITGISVREGSVEAAERGWDGVVANILAPFFLERAADLTPLVRPGGVFVISGLLASERDRVATALEAAGITVREVLRDGEWAAFLGARA